MALATHSGDGMRVSNVDLNLLVALGALLGERNVARAATRIGRSPSATSHALARLRTLIGDALLVQHGREMVLTARAAGLVAPVQAALNAVAGVLSTQLFDPKVAKLRVVLSTSDYAQLLLLPGILSRLAKEAPGIELRILSLQENLHDVLSSGHVDLAVAPVCKADLQLEGLYSKRLFAERLVCLVRRRHPLTSKTLTVTGYAAASHLLVAPRGKAGGFVDDALGKLGLRRRVAAVVPNFVVAPHLIASSDLVLTLPEGLAGIMAKTLGLVVLETPPELVLPPIAISLIWHERTHRAPEHEWVRSLFVREGEGRQETRALNSFGGLRELGAAAPALHALVNCTQRTDDAVDGTRSRR
jgi:DNA-binding transcriptional LysR family regulator